MIRHLGYFVQYITFRLTVIYYCLLGFFYYFLVCDTIIIHNVKRDRMAWS